MRPCPRNTSQIQPQQRFLLSHEDSVLYQDRDSHTDVASLCLQN
uniref:Uncharacterized protein n=1 Tax=Podoviridae sp. cttxo15 TaxID=2826584 RepID=A0A8S5N2M6_9CAUD|nr:MAG TPA: hypothetical protein [Podoviridae sp. cttxo15]